MSNKMDRPLATVDGRTLMDRPLEPPNFVVDTLISQGLHILAGSPKVGKSWLALWLAVTVAKGEPVWGMSVKQGTTLYLCLEDSVLRIQNRLFEITEDAPDSVHFCTECAPIGQGLEEQVEGFLVAHPDTVLVLVDTLQMVRPVHDATYANDYRDLSVLKRLADKHGIAILLIHHLRKETADDVFNRISGTTAISGAVDSSFTLVEDRRGSGKAKLSCIGRDIEYCRLSRDDNLEGDSNSIQNQKLILQKYADENGFQNTRFYVDDGYSGANFNRPAFEQMMDDMSNGDIAVIITKDLSRLGRNQLHTGLYIEEIFPSNDVRYIAVNDNVDTKYENSNELMPFKNLFNEWHVRDCSRKVRNVVNAKAQRGIRVGTRAPYGYRKGATKDSPLLVDEEAAAVVKRIFAMCAGGMGPAQIAKQLKKECIYSPSMYAYTKFGTSHSGLNAERPYNWTGDMVADMLQNMVYLGHTVNLRYSTKSYKDKKRCERPKSEWLIFENTHEELVDQETWDIVQEVRSHKRRRTNMDEQNMFSGLVYCADCGKPMVLHRAHTMKPEQNHFTCRTYKKDGAEVCSAHYIREVALKEIVLETIRRATEFARSDPERFAAYIQQKQSTEVAKEIRGLERELSTMRKRDGELDVVFKRMYEDSALGRVSNEQFRLLSEAYSKEKAQLAEAIPATEERLEKLRSSMANAKNFIAKARKFTDMTELTPELLRTFVAKIIVYEKEVKYSKHAPQKIHICFRDFNLNETDDMLLCGETTEKADSTIALPA